MEVRDVYCIITYFLYFYLCCRYTIDFDTDETAYGTQAKTSYLAFIIWNQVESAELFSDALKVVFQDDEFNFVTHISKVRRASTKAGRKRMWC
jgi:hypothetical protein